MFPSRALTANATYGFQVRAVNDVGAGEMEDTEGPAASAPTLPQNFTAEADNNDPEIELEWDDPADEGGAPLLGYHLQVRVGDDGAWTDVDTFAGDDTNTAEEITLDELTFGETYHYRIRALNLYSTLRLAEPSDAQKEMLDALEWATASDTVASNWPARVGGVEEGTGTEANRTTPTSWRPSQMVASPSPGPSPTTTASRSPPTDSAG